MWRGGDDRRGGDLGSWRLNRRDEQGRRRGDADVVFVHDRSAEEKFLAEGGSTRRLGLGISIFCEQAAHGTSVYHGWGIPMVPGFEQAVARMTPDGGLEIRVGIQSHGQGLETTLAQVAHEILGIDIDRIRVLHGDTGMTPYSTGTWGSRCMVMAGGAVGAACRELGERCRKIGAHLLAPANLSIDQLQHDLSALAREMMVDIALGDRPPPSVELNAKRKTA